MPGPMLRRAAPSIAVALAAVLAGCGSAGPVPVANRTIGVKLDEYRITPERISAPAGELRIIARNRGRLTHNLKIERVPADPEGRPEVLGGTATLHPGERGESRITLEPGTYRLACTIANHDDLGQYGELVVR